MNYCLSIVNAEYIGKIFREIRGSIMSLGKCCKSFTVIETLRKLALPCFRREVLCSMFYILVEFEVKGLLVEKSLFCPLFCLEAYALIELEFDVLFVVSFCKMACSFSMFFLKNK